MVGSFERRGGMLVIGLPELQQVFDNLRSGGGLVLELTSQPGLGVREIILVADHRMDEMLYEMGSLEVDKSELN